WPRDWSSDVCSSDLDEIDGHRAAHIRIDSDIETGQRGERAQHVLDIGILEVQRDRLTSEDFLSSAQLARAAKRTTDNWSRLRLRSEERRVGKGCESR